MNRKCIVFALLLSVVLIGTGCNKDDEEKGIIPVEQISKAFAEKYPDAQDVTFEIEGNYYEAEFQNDGRPTTAWFTDQGQWMMEKIKYPFNQLPGAVMNAFQQGSYGSWVPDDCYLIRRLDMGPVYKIEVENGNTETDLYYSALGNLIKAITGGNDDRPLVIPEKITAFIQLTFAGAELLDMQTGAGGITLALMDGSTYKVAKLNNQYTWQSTTWALTEQEVPEMVRNGFAASAYGSDTVLSIHILLNADGSFYLYEVENGGKRTIATFDVFGQLVKAEPA